MRDVDPDTRDFFVLPHAPTKQNKQKNSTFKERKKQSKMNSTGGCSPHDGRIGRNGQDHEKNHSSDNEAESQAMVFSCKNRFSLIETIKAAALPSCLFSFLYTIIFKLTIHTLAMNRVPREGTGSVRRKTVDCKQVELVFGENQFLLRNGAIDLHFLRLGLHDTFRGKSERKKHEFFNWIMSLSSNK